MDVHTWDIKIRRLIMNYSSRLAIKKMKKGYPMSKNMGTV